MPISVIGCCFVWLVAPLRRGFFWRFMAAALAPSSGVDGSRLTLQRWICVFSGKAKALTGTEACVIKTGLVPGVLVENLETVVARMVIGLFVDYARVSWSSKAFKTVTTLVRGLVLSSVSGRDPDMMLTLPKSMANLARWLKIGSRKEYTCQ
jgi:hypothetical protein